MGWQDAQVVVSQQDNPLLRPGLDPNGLRPPKPGAPPARVPAWMQAPVAQTPAPTPIPTTVVRPQEPKAAPPVASDAPTMSPLDRFGTGLKDPIEGGAQLLTHVLPDAIVKPVNPDDPAVAEVIAECKKQPGAVGIRIMFREGVSADPADPGINRVLSAAAKHGLALNCMITGRLEQAAGLAARNPDTQMVIDHLGLPQPHHPPAAPRPLAALPELLALVTVLTQAELQARDVQSVFRSARPAAASASCAV